MIPVTICDEIGYMALDTGARQTVINQNYFDINGEELRATTFSEELQTSTVKNSEIYSLQIGEQMYKNLAVICFDMDYVEKELRKNDNQIKFFGSIGMDILGSQKFLIDYRLKEVLFRPRVYKESNNKEGHL